MKESLIRNYRKNDKKMTLLDVSLQTKLRETVIAAIETRRTVAYPKQRVALAAFFDKPESELFGEDGFALLGPE